MEFDLIASWLDPCIAEHVPKTLDVEIRDTNTLYEALVNKCLHLSPNLVHGEVNSFVSCFLTLNFYCLNSDGPMNQIKIELVNLEFGEGSLASGFAIFNLIPPNFGYHV